MEQAMKKLTKMDLQYKKIIFNLPLFNALKKIVKV